LPEKELGEYSLGNYSISFLKQLIDGKLQESVPDPELIDLIHCGQKLKDAQTPDFYGIQPGSTVHVLHKSGLNLIRNQVFKMLSNKESLDQIIVATSGLSSNLIVLGVLQEKDLFSVLPIPTC
jgi:hypothetical protein